MGTRVSGNTHTIRANSGYVRPEKREVAVQLACN